MSSCTIIGSETYRDKLWNYDISKIVSFFLINWSRCCTILCTDTNYEIIFSVIAHNCEIYFFSFIFCTTLRVTEKSKLHIQSLFFYFQCPQPNPIMEFQRSQMSYWVRFANFWRRRPSLCQFETRYRS